MNLLYHKQGSKNFLQFVIEITKLPLAQSYAWSGKIIERKMSMKNNKAQNSFLKGVLISTLIICFTVLICGGFWIFKSQAPIPLKVVNSQGDVLTTQEQITGGQAVFQKYGLMDYATVLGYGSYLGPDYTAESVDYPPLG